jgi:hypothetical protein
MAVQTVTVIRQADLQQIHDLQGEIADKQTTLDKLIESVKQLKFANAPIEKGRFDAVLAFTSMHNVAWKKVVIEQLGYDYMEAVRKATPVIRRCDLKVVEHAIPPLWKHLEQEMIE